MTLASHLRALGGDRRAGPDAFGADRHVPGGPGLADGRRDRSDALAPRRQPTPSARMGSGRAGGDRSAPRPVRAFIVEWPARWSSARSRRSSRWRRGHGSWLLALPFAALWLASPAVARCVSLPPAAASRLTLSDDDARALRLTARRTWRFFETFVTPADHMLPPDNFQEDPRPRSRIGPRRPISASICCRWPARAISAGSEPVRRSIGLRRRWRPWVACSDCAAILQLVRHARPASARSEIRLDRRQRQSRRASDRARQRLQGMA